MDAQIERLAFGFNPEVLSAAKLVYQHVHESLNGQAPHAQDTEEINLEAALLQFISKVEDQDTILQLGKLKHTAWLLNFLILNIMNNIGVAIAKQINSEACMLHVSF